jgi:peptidyl-tRNA hydrolase, PTH1 family
MLNKFKLVAGLGNPGPKYKDTYHNAGFMAIDYIVDKLKNSQSLKTSHRTNFDYVKINNVVLVKPITFMNESGKAIKEAATFFKIKPEEILVIHDDSDINLGSYKLSFNRGPAGHHGIESIIKHLKTKYFTRLRVGIRPQIGKSPRPRAVDFVLRKINKNDKKALQSTFKSFIEKVTEKENPVGVGLMSVSGK